jgi:hypothetical protein
VAAFESKPFRVIADASDHIIVCPSQRVKLRELTFSLTVTHPAQQSPYDEQLLTDLTNLESSSFKSESSRESAGGADVLLSMRRPSELRIC